MRLSLELFSVFYLIKNPLLIKKIDSNQNEIFLTFDDGPDSDFTSEVLDILTQENWPSSFFVVGQKARENKNLIQRMEHEGHAVLSHSIDHGYFHYFKGKEHLKTWLQNSLQDLSEITQKPQTAFRPPAGVLTPPLLAAAKELEVPLILWNHRFFDSVYPWTEKKIQKNLPRLHQGDIILLHDQQPLKRRKVFSYTLQTYLRQLKDLGFKGTALSPDRIPLCKQLIKN